MPTNLTSDPRHPLQRAKQLAEQARVFDARGQKSSAEGCRRRAFAWLQFVALSGEDVPAPNAWLLDQLIAAHLACAGEDVPAAAGALAH